MILNERLQCFWYEIAVGDSVFDDAGGGETLQRQVVHDGDVVEGVGGEEGEGAVAGPVGVVHFSAGLEEGLDELRIENKGSILSLRRQIKICTKIFTKIVEFEIELKSFEVFVQIISCTEIRSDFKVVKKVDEF